MVLAGVISSGAPAVQSINLQARVLANGWFINDFAANASGTVVAAGGGRSKTAYGLGNRLIESGVEVSRTVGDVPGRHSLPAASLILLYFPIASGAPVSPKKLMVMFAAPAALSRKNWRTVPDQDK